MGPRAVAYLRARECCGKKDVDNVQEGGGEPLDQVGLQEGHEDHLD